jgi:hypothetical protein
LWWNWPTVWLLAIGAIFLCALGLSIWSDVFAGRLLDLCSGVAVSHELHGDLVRLVANFHIKRLVVCAGVGSSPDLEASLVLAAMIADLRYVEKHYDAGNERLGKQEMGLGKEGEIQARRINGQ